MNCRNCNTPYEPTPSLYQMESRNRLFCFEEVPALKCPNCEHLFLPAATIKIILEKITELSQGSPIPYIKYKWNKKTNIQTPDELADELLKKGSNSENDDFDDDLGLEPQPPTEETGKSGATSASQRESEETPHFEADSKETPTTEAPAVQSTKSAENIPLPPEKPTAPTISATRTKGVVVRKRTRTRTGNAA